MKIYRDCIGSLIALLVLGAGTSGPSEAALDLGPEEIVQAGGADLMVPGYSTPSLHDWNDDRLPDLIVGEGGGGILEGKVRVYLNVGTTAAPLFSDFFYVQSDGADLSLIASGCLGLFPRVVYWDADDRKDLLVGTALGNARIYLNVGTDAEPTFDAGTTLQVGSPGSKTDIDVGSRATPIVVDWDGDGWRDLVIGALDGFLYLFLNEGSDTDPDYINVAFVQESGANLLVPGARSSPCVRDLDDDGKKDILSGNTNGQLIFYSNVGTHIQPDFEGSVLVEADGVPIDLPDNARSRPALCDWTGDGFLDVLIGAADGMIHLFQGIPDNTPVSLDQVAFGQLHAPWPNPCNPQAIVSFTVPDRTRARVLIHDLRGRRIGVLAERTFAAGTHRLLWRGEDSTGRSVPAGVYLVNLETPGYTASRRLTIVR
jgi:hypothetical protein